MSSNLHAEGETRTSISEGLDARSEDLLLGGQDSQGRPHSSNSLNRNTLWQRLKWRLQRKPVSTTAWLFALGVVVGCLLDRMLRWSQLFSGNSSNYAHRTGGDRDACSHFEEDCTDSAPFIFDSVFSFLKQWPSSYAPNGHSLVPGTLSPYVPLYHGRQVKGSLPKPTYFALNPEMSVGIYGSPGVAYLHTCTPTKPLSILYVDGTSASLTTTGSLDSQFAILNGTVPRDPTYEQTYNENARAQQWCSFLAPLKIDGVVRMNAGFEVMLCDFERSGVECQFTVNMTVPGAEDNPKDPSLPKDGNRIPPEGTGNRFAPQYSWEWVRSATWAYGSHAASGGSLRERSIKLDLCEIVTYYDPSLRSLNGSHLSGIQDGGDYQNGWGLRRGHRLLDLSEYDALVVQKWTKEAIKASRSKRAKCSGVDWQLTTELITDQHKGRTLEISYQLAQAVQGNLAPREAMIATRDLSHTATVPYWEYADTPAAVDGNTATALRRCTEAYTAQIRESDMNDFEIVIKEAVERVLARVCAWEIDTFIRADAWLQSQASLADDVHAMAELESLFAASTKLINDIGWETWFDCPDKCGEMELCVIPMWPVVYAPNMFQGGIYGGEKLTEEEMESFWRPKCLSKLDWDCGGTRGREPDFRLPTVARRECKYSPLKKQQ